MALAGEIERRWQRLGGGRGLPHDAQRFRQQRESSVFLWVLLGPPGCEVCAWRVQKRRADVEPVRRFYSLPPSFIRSEKLNDQKIAERRHQMTGKMKEGKTDNPNRFPPPWFLNFCLRFLHCPLAALGTGTSRFLSNCASAWTLFFSIRS